MSIIKSAGQQFDLHLDVCVVGGGACGLTAAIQAARSGVNVAVFEHGKTPSGSTAMTIGLICAAGTKEQSELGIPDNADIFYDDIIAATDGQTDETMARVMADQSGRTLDWLIEEIGCDLTLETSWPGYGHSQFRTHGTPNRNGEELMAMLINGANEAGVEIVTQATVQNLIVDDHDHLKGITYDSPDGLVNISCDAVILACSGFGANRELVSRYIPEMSKAIYYGSENHRGDAILWGEALGAEIADLGSYQGVGTHAVPYDYGLPHTVMIDGGFKVNQLGQRFENEVENISRQAVDVLQQPGAMGWIIYDDRAHKKAIKLFAGYKDNAALLTSKAKASTVADLAETAGVDAAGLEGTFKTIEQYIMSGEADEFGRVFDTSQQLKAPFFAVKVTGALYHTQGGLAIDSKARVKKKSGVPFENLFAGGGAARSVSGPAERGYLPAMGLATAVVFGRLAGQEAAQVSSLAKQARSEGIASS